MNGACDPEALFDLVDGTLDPAERARVEQHLQQCQQCQARKAQLEQLGTLARGLLGPEAEGVLPQASDRIWQKLEAGLPAAGQGAGRRAGGWQRPLLLAAVLVLAAVAAYPLFDEWSTAVPPQGTSGPQGGSDTLRGADGSAVARVMQKLESHDPDVRTASAEALGLLGAKVKEAVPRLIGALKDPSADVRAAAATALGQIGVREEAMEALKALEQDPDEAVRKAAAEALGKLEGSKAGG